MSASDQAGDEGGDAAEAADGSDECRRAREAAIPYQLVRLGVQLLMFGQETWRSR